jgi:hypothetical protein
MSGNFNFNATGSFSSFWDLSSFKINKCNSYKPQEKSKTLKAKHLPSGEVACRVVPGLVPAGMLTTTY